MDWFFNDFHKSEDFTSEKKCRKNEIQLDRDDLLTHVRGSGCAANRLRFFSVPPKIRSLPVSVAEGASAASTLAVAEVGRALNSRLNSIQRYRLSVNFQTRIKRVPTRVTHIFRCTVRYTARMISSAEDNMSPRCRIAHAQLALLSTLFFPAFLHCNATPRGTWPVTWITPLTCIGQQRSSLHRRFYALICNRPRWTTNKERRHCALCCFPRFL